MVTALVCVSVMDDGQINDLCVRQNQREQKKMKIKEIEDMSS